MDALRTIRRKADKFERNDLKYSLYYLTCFDEEGTQSEINGHKSYCCECIDKTFDKLFEDFKTGGSKKIHEDNDVSHGDDFEIVELSYSEESMPERDDFVRCEDCGCLIRAGNLHTFSDELENFLLDEYDLKLKSLSKEECYIIRELIYSEDSISKYPELIKQLRNKIKASNCNLSKAE
jgi:hypothetical protein